MFPTYEGVIPVRHIRVWWLCSLQRWQQLEEWLGWIAGILLSRDNHIDLIPHSSGCPVHSCVLKWHRRRRYNKIRNWSHVEGSRIHYLHMRDTHLMELLGSLWWRTGMMRQWKKGMEVGWTMGMGWSSFGVLLSFWGLMPSPRIVPDQPNCTPTISNHKVDPCRTASP